MRWRESSDSYYRDQTNIIPANTTEKFETSYRYNVPEEGYYYRDGGIDDNRYHQHGRGGRDHSMNNRTTSSSKNYNYDSSFYESESRSGGGGHHARSVQMIESPLVQTTPRHQHHYGSGRHSSAGGALDRAADLDEHFHEEQIIVRPGGKLPAPPPPAPAPEPVILQLAQPESGKKTTTTETREEFYTSCGGTEPSYFREIKPVQQEAQTTTTTRTTEFDEIEMERLAYDSGEEYEQRRRPMLDDKEVQASLTTSVTKPKYSKPTFTSRFEDTLYYRDGDRIKLEANLLPLGDKSLHVEWLKNGEPLRLNSRTTTFHENGRVGLEIYPADLSDEAIYTCQAISDNGYAAITTRLKHIPERVPVYRYEKRKTPELAREPEPPQPEGFPPMLTPGDTSIKTPRPPRQRPCFKSDLKPIDLDEGQGIHLEAKLEPLDDDNLKVDWYKDEEPLIETPKTKAGQDKGKVFLDMDDMKPKDSGVYTCKASNDFGEAIIKAPITVHPRVPKPPEQEPVPVTDYWWKDKYPPLKKTPTAPAEISPIVIHKKKRLPPLPPPEEPPDLEFIKAQGRENRKYGTEVDLPPRFITDISDLQANEWDKIRFEARLEPANDKTTQIFWYHDGKILNASSRIKTLFDYGVVILEIADITTIDAGLYECIATNNFGSDSTRAILTVREDDERIIHQTGLSSQRSSVARVKDIEETVERTIVELYPSPASFPLPGQGQQTSFSQQQQHQKHFTTDEIEQQKFYKREQEEYLVDRSTSGLATGKRPIFMTELVDIRAKKHETIRLEAKVEPSIREDSTLQVGWYKNGKLMFIEEGGRIRTYNTDTGLIVLEINDTQTSDSGEYVCVIRNVSGQCLSKCKIVCRDDHYGEPPHFLNRYLRLDNLNEGDTAHVEFKLEPSDDQNMQVEWFFNGHSLKKSYRLKTVYDFGYAILDISPVTPEDSGVYECKATNLYGSKTAVAVIDVKCPRNKMVQNLGYVVVDAPKILDFKGIHAQPNTFTEICKEQVETSKLFEETEKVVVHEPQPSAPRIFKPLRDSIVTQGQQASFQCTVFGYPAPTVQWFKNDKPIQVTTQNPLQPPYISGTAIESKDLPGHYVHTLKLAECFLEDEGMYTCQLSNAAGSIRTSATLKVQQLRPDIEGPSFIRSLDSTRIAEGKSVIFKCTLTGKPTPVVTWFKDGQALLSSDKYQLSYAGTFCKLTVTNCQESDSGTYVCKAQNIAGTAECSAALLVERVGMPKRDQLLPPQIVTPLVPQRVIEGQNVILQCQFTPFPYKVITWSKDEQPLTSQPHKIDISHEQGVCILRIFNVYPIDEGIYTCKAVSEDFDLITAASLQIFPDFNQMENPPQLRAPISQQAIPKLIKPLSPTKVNIGETATLECIVRSQPPPQVTWFHEGRPLKPIPVKYEMSHSTEDRIQLKIHDARPQDQGTYTCKAWNGYGEISTSTHVLVEESTKTVIDTTHYHQVDAIESYGKPQNIISSPEVPRKKHKGDQAGPSSFEKPYERQDLEILVSIEPGKQKFQSPPMAEISQLTLTEKPPIVQTLTSTTTKEYSEEIIESSSVPRGLENIAVQELPPRVATPIQFSSQAPASVHSGRDIFITLDKDLSSPPTQLPLVFTDETMKESIITIASTIEKTIPIDREVPVFIPPKIIKPLRDSRQLDGQSVILECKIIAQPFPKVSWFHDEKKIEESTDFRFFQRSDGTNVLYITEAYPEDRGLYTCRAENELGTAETSASLIIEISERDYSSQSYTTPPMVQVKRSRDWTSTDEDDSAERGIIQSTKKIIESRHETYEKREKLDDTYEQVSDQEITGGLKSPIPRNIIIKIRHKQPELPKILGDVEGGLNDSVITTRTEKITKECIMKREEIYSTRLTPSPMRFSSKLPPNIEVSEGDTLVFRIISPSNGPVINVTWLKDGKYIQPDKHTVQYGKSSDTETSISSLLPKDARKSVQEMITEDSDDVARIITREITQEDDETRTEEVVWHELIVKDVRKFDLGNYVCHAVNGFGEKDSTSTVLTVKISKGDFESDVAPSFQKRPQQIQEQLISGEDRTSTTSTAGHQENVVVTGCIKNNLILRKRDTFDLTHHNDEDADGCLPLVLHGGEDQNEGMMELPVVENTILDKFGQVPPPIEKKKWKITEIYCYSSNVLVACFKIILFTCFLLFCIQLWLRSLNVIN